MRTSRSTNCGPLIALALSFAAPGCASDAAEPAQPSAGEARVDAGVDVMSCIRSDDCAEVLVVAHRGQHLQHPENSVAGLRAAAEMGVDMVEIDVRHTADDVVVLMHDGDVDRTTDGSGRVADLTWQDIQQLTLNGADPSEPESVGVPRFDSVMGLARELGVALYVDQKTDRSDLVLADVVAGSYQDVVLIRDSLPGLVAATTQAPEVLVMPPVSNEAELDEAVNTVATLRIVEVASVDADPAFTATIRGRGLLAQQDVMLLGDVPAFASGDYSGWSSFVDAGVALLQTDRPDLLLPAVWRYRRTGEFPQSGPAGR
jgi:glycerophosphoryl diester phosphodiesterase